MPPETPDECPVCGVDVSVDLTVFCSVSCQVVALNRLDKAKAVCRNLELHDGALVDPTVVGGQECVEHFKEWKALREAGGGE